VLKCAILYIYIYIYICVCVYSIDDYFPLARYRCISFTELIYMVTYII